MIVPLGVAFLATGCGDGDTVRSSGTTVTAEPSARDPNQRYEVAATVLESAQHGPQLCLGGIAESYPPQCGGPDLVGWDWDDVGGEESAAGTTWTDAAVVGTFDGERFVLTARPSAPPQSESPAPDVDFSPPCDEPDPGDPTAGASDFEEGAGSLSTMGDVVAVWVSDPAGSWDGPYTLNVIVRPGRGDEARAFVRERWRGALCVIERDQPTLDELEAVQAEATAAESQDLGSVLGAYTHERRGVVILEVAVADAVARDWASQRWGDLVELNGRLEPVG